jgi:hypothetical protein
LLSNSKAKKGLKSGCGCLAAVVPKDEFIKVDLELRLAHPVVGAD